MFILYEASLKDMKYHTIEKNHVLAIMISVMIYVFVVGTSVFATVSFLITLILFGAITLFTRGGFGFGDTIVLAFLGWFIGNPIHLQYFFFILVVITLLWTYYMMKNNNNKINIKGKERVSVENLKPGMILANDYFMNGLTEKDIIRLREEGHDYLDIKHAYPFIPVIFISFIIFLGLQGFFL